MGGGYSHSTGWVGAVILCFSLRVDHTKHGPRHQFRTEFSDNNAEEPVFQLSKDNAKALALAMVKHS